MKIGNHTVSKDFGPAPYVTSVAMAGIKNTNFRTTIWTGEYMQMTLMAIP